MSFFNKMLSKIGVGSASVETELFNDVFVPGEFVRGKVTVKGGSVEQNIDSIYFKVKSTYEDEIKIEDDDEEKEINITRNAVIMDTQISEPFTINPGQIIEFEIDFTLPVYTPVTAGKTKTWVETGLDIKMAVDPADKDYIHVQPHPLVDAVLGSAMDMGLEVYKVVCEPAPRNMNMKVPFVQEFSLRPVEGHLKNRLEEIELIFRPSENSGLDVFMEVDRKLKGLSGRLAKMIGTDETMVRFSVDYENLDNLTVMLDHLIEQNC
ncbi:MAG: sporulation protein [Desulfamplus sp.]|nr:sporulation protein [Desulfamplus sp.]